MTTLLVVDIGNSRLKWGRCQGEQVVEAASLPLQDPEAWARQLQSWQRHAPFRWVVSGVQPAVISRLLAWLDAQGSAAVLVDSFRQVPVRIAVDLPERVGLDRLLNAVAAQERKPAGCPAVLVDAGSAVTVDWLDAEGVFAGGAIFPGLRLMAEALHRYTALLPLVEVDAPLPPMPGRSTVPAITAGIHGAVVGGIDYLVHRLAQGSTREPIVYLTGGDAALLAPALTSSLSPRGRESGGAAAAGCPGSVEVWPFMTLEGIRLTAKNLP
jgi:type III pantothenate kinase